MRVVGAADLMAQSIINPGLNNPLIRALIALGDLLCCGHLPYWQPKSDQPLLGTLFDLLRKLGIKKHLIYGLHIIEIGGHVVAIHEVTEFLITLKIR